MKYVDSEGNSALHVADGICMLILLEFIIDNLDQRAANDFLTRENNRGHNFAFHHQIRQKDHQEKNQPDSFEEFFTDEMK